MRLTYVAPALALAAWQMLAATPAQANGCGGTAPVVVNCVTPHGPWTSSEPFPTISWGTGFTGPIQAEIHGVYGATKIRTCNVVAGQGQCSTTRNDHMQCCTEDWVLICYVGGVGSWSCNHTGG